MWPVVLAALTDTMRAVAGYRGPGEATSGEIPVYEGAEAIQAENDHAPLRLLIGYAGDNQASDLGQSGQGIIAVAGTNRPAEENGSITCRVEAWRGNTSLPAGAARALRAEAYAVLAAVDDACRLGSPGPRLGIDPADGNGQLLWALVSEHRVQEYEEDDGVRVDVDFVVQFKGRI